MSKKCFFMISEQENAGLCRFCKHNPQIKHDETGRKQIDLTKGRCIHSYDAWGVICCPYFLSNCEGCKFYGGFRYEIFDDYCEDSLGYSGYYCKH